MSLLKKDMGVLEKAIAIAACLHSGQTRKDGEPYILHPIRVMTQLRQESKEVQAMAVLHDVLEDCVPRAVQSQFKNCAIPFCVRTGVAVLTHRKQESYRQYIRRIGAAGNPYVRIKLMDIQDNCRSIFRLQASVVNTKWAQKQIAKYLWAMNYLLKSIGGQNG